MSQIGLPFDWAGQAHSGRFILSEANRLAVQHIDNWRAWPIPISILTGPSRSGKTLLGNYFVNIAEGTLIDNADQVDDRTLFHAWNVARDTGRPLLLISGVLPEAWGVDLPDLRSRILAAPHVQIEQPDDGLVLALIETGLAHAGSAYSADVPEWLSRRCERSYDAVAALVEELNRLSVSSGRKISVPLVKETLQNSAFLPIVPRE